MLADELPAICEDDALGAVTQLMLKYLTGQSAPNFPSLEVRLDCPVEEFAQKVLSQHYLLAYGDHREKIEDLCKILGIEII